MMPGGQAVNMDGAGVPEVTDVPAPSRTWRLDFARGRVTGTIDGLEAVRQAVFKVLQTERFRYLIYSFNYGVELESLVGEDPLYVRSEIGRRIREALGQDDRIRGVEQVEAEPNGDGWLVRFTVVTGDGSFAVTQEVA